MAALIPKNNGLKTQLFSASKSRSFRPWAHTVVYRFHTWRKRQEGAYDSTSHMKTPVRLAYISYENMFQTMLVDKPPVIVMHEVLDSKDHWQAFAQELHTLSTRKVFTVDLRNHGESYHSQYMRYSQMSADVKGFMDEMKIQKACLIGHGMGGRVALDMALRYPVAVDRLVVVDASPGKTSEYHKKIGSQLGVIGNVVLPSEYMTMTGARRFVENILSREVTDDIARFILTQNLVRVEVDGKPSFKWRINLRTITKQYNELSLPLNLSRKRSAKLIAFLHGGAEFRFSKDEVNELGRQFSKALFVNIPTAGHFVQTQEPKYFMTFIMNFLGL